MSWGISVRFQTLSPIQRQVAHALLTRPPLSCLYASRRINKNSSVRLECVMHAASVHPEPGSNSRSNYIISFPFGWLQSSRAIYLSFFYFLEFSALFLDEICISHFCFALYFSLVVQFSMTIRCRSRGQLDYYTTFTLLCQYLFEKKFKKIFYCFFDTKMV